MPRDGTRTYTRGKTLGEGTFGVVFLATSPEQETVAIKRYKVRQSYIDDIRWRRLVEI